MRLTQKMLKELLTYNPNTGIFTNKVNRGISRKGEQAGGLNDNGYVRVRIKGEKYGAHRLAFLYMLGYFPEQQVDHINGICDDNRWCNLRHVSSSCNMQNQKEYCNNTSGFSGVQWHKKTMKWQAGVCINKKCIYLGGYDTKIDAALARLTFEVNCPNWSCNQRGVLIKQIKKAWPEFNLQSVA